MVLQQIQAAYRIEEDRILLRVSFRKDDGSLQEIRAWMTRHLLKTLWPGIIRAMEAQVALDQPQAAHARAEIVSMQHEASVTELRSRGDFSTPFAAKIDDFPFGEQPILLVQAHILVETKQAPRIKFVSARSGNFEVGFTPSMLHGFCTILQDAVKHAHWDIELRLPGSPAESVDSQRVLN